ncbi:hypothetical protein KDN24_10485 [Bacillus sp. Bva_UNVM-123]|uniref:hypothetical protein n=1 Tax=Bacillus sp. Bva_UNVM-123 TaxID=2829798 RepID=UPI00391F0093
MIAFIENGVTYSIFATKDEVTVIANTDEFALKVKSKTFKAAIADAKKAVKEFAEPVVDLPF